MKPIKAVLLIMALAALTACGDGCETVASSEVISAVVMPEPIPAPVPTPSPAPTPASITACPQSGCEPSPAPLPVRPIVVTPSPTPTCVRDTSIALVLVDGVLTDNCGNKYGQTV